MKSTYENLVADKKMEGDSMCGFNWVRIGTSDEFL
jgi:hypothetical protein